jgi:hypothetical protein
MENGGGPSGCRSLVSENFTACRRREKEHSDFNLLAARHGFCLYYRARDLPCKVKGSSPMQSTAITRLQEPLPLGIAILINIALSLLMWNIALRIAGLLFAG